MTTKKHSKTHTSVRSKKKSAAKASKAGGSTASTRKTLESEQQKLEKLTLKVFQTVYDDYQQGKFRRIL